MVKKRANLSGLPAGLGRLNKGQTRCDDPTPFMNSP
jgi:hypothetical protein